MRKERRRAGDSPSRPRGDDVSLPSPGVIAVARHAAASSSAEPLLVAAPPRRRGRPPRSRRRLVDDRHLAEVAVDIQRYRSHSILLTVDDDEENRWANDIDRSRLTAQPGKPQG